MNKQQWGYLQIKAVFHFLHVPYQIFSLARCYREVRKVAPTRKNESTNFVLQGKHTADTIRCLKYYLAILPEH